jgi:hypothetical protein
MAIMNSRSSGRVARRLIALAFTCAALLPQIALAQPQGIEPRAKELLKAATDFLAKQPRFSVDTRSTLEVVLTSGQKIQFDHTAKQAVQRPNKLRAERTGDLVDQVFYYDGKSLTLNNPGSRTYATVAAPATLEEMISFARDKLDVVTPAGDLLNKNAYDILLTEVTDGFVVGRGVVEGARCAHLAFRAPHVDWQIWIQEGKEPLIRKFVITTKDVANAPQFSVVATKWNLKPQFSDATFVFTPPKGAQKVEFLPLGKR